MTAAPAPSVRRLPFKYRAINRLAGVLKQVGLQPVRFRVEGLLKDASKQTGAADFGDPAFRDPLARLAASLEREAKLEFLNALSHRAILLGMLKKRLALQRDLARYPGIAATPIVRPLFILGMPRSGTTLLHSLLGMDAGARWLHPWESEDPWPEALGPDLPDPREARFRASLEARRAKNPQLSLIHDFDSPGECEKLFDPTFFSHSHALALDIPSYAQWLEGASWQEWLPAYRHYRQQLQRLSWYRPGGTWVLRSPQHMGVLETILEVFPDARFVHLHRDPKRTIPSAASLVLSQVQKERPADQHKLGGFIAGRLARRLDRAIDSRETLPADRVLDVQYPDLLQRPIETVRGIYDRFGMEMTAATERGMRGWLADNPQHKRGVHKYSLEQFGLTAEGVDRLFARYCARFDVRTE